MSCRSSAVLVAISLVGASCGGRAEFHGGAEWRDPEVPTSPPTHAAFVRPKLIVIEADWCPFCRTAKPAIATAYARYRDRVDLVVLDVTDDATTAAAERTATEEGVAAFFQQYRGRTPTAGVFLAPDEGRRVHGNMEDPETIAEELRFAVNQFPLVSARAH